MIKVAFYSYKGGAGRTTTAWNTIQRLMQIPNLRPTVEQPYVIVDADVDSAGSTFLYGGGRFLRNINNYRTIQQCAKPDNTAYTRNSLVEKMCPIGDCFGVEDKAVLLIGAKPKDPDDDTERQDMAQNKTNVHAYLKANIIEECEGTLTAKAIFFDTPSGTQTFAEWSITNSDVVVCCMRPTTQFREGTLGVLKSFIADNVNTPERTTNFIVTPTAVCYDAGQSFYGYEYPQKAWEAITEEFVPAVCDISLQEAFGQYVKLDMITTTDTITINDKNYMVFGIPEIKRFKWKEDCLGTLQQQNVVLNEDETIAIRRYDLLAALIVKYHE